MKGKKYIISEKKPLQTYSEISPYGKEINTQQEYLKALERIEQLFDALPNTPECKELELLAILVDNYEEKCFPIN